MGNAIKNYQKKQRKDQHDAYREVGQIVKEKLTDIYIRDKGVTMRDLRPGDVVHCQGIICTIKEIAWQEPWEMRKAYYLEFRDTNGVYRSWKQNFDGGYAELKGDD